MLGILAGVCVWILLDFHYCRCITFWAQKSIQAEQDARASLDVLKDRDDENPRRRSTKDGSKKRRKKSSDANSDNTDLTNNSSIKKKKTKGKKKKKQKGADDYDPQNANLEELR